MKSLIKTDEKIAFLSEMSISLANAIRRTANEIPVLAVSEVDIYKNDSALYDEILAHRVGLIPLKNQKLKEDDEIQMKFSIKADGERIEVLSKELGKNSVYPDIPIVILDKDQEIELVAKAKQGKGVSHAKFSPGLVYYRKYNKIEIGKEAEKRQELSEIYPEVFSWTNNKLTLKNDWALDLDIEDLEEFKGIKVVPTDEIVFIIESWGQMPAEEIFLDSIKILSKNLDEVEKKLK